MHPVVICPTCGCRNKVERRLEQPEIFWIVCTTCEASVHVEVTRAILVRQKVKA